MPEDAESCRGGNRGSLVGGLLSTCCCALPLQKVRIFCLSRETGPHHDGLETLPIDGPELAVGRSSYRRGPFAVIEDRQLPQYFARCQSTEVLSVPRHLDSAL